MTRSNVLRWVESSRFQNSIIALIVLNAIILGLETSPTIMAEYGAWLHRIDTAILAVFVAEICLRIYAHGWRFFTRPWSIFDVLVVGIALLPANDGFSALRALRVLRVLRIISVVPSMRRVVEGLLAAIPGIFSVAMIMLLFFYVFAVMGTHLYAANFPEWFGTLGRTMYSLFQIMTLESWSMGIVRPVMEQHPHAWIFFISYILVSTFTMLNLFIAVIVNAMHSGADIEAEQSREETREMLNQRLDRLEQHIVKLAERQR